MSRSKGETTPSRDPRTPKPTAWIDSGNGPKPDHFSARHERTAQQQDLGQQASDIYDVMDRDAQK